MSADSGYSGDGRGDRSHAVINRSITRDGDGRVSDAGSELNSRTLLREEVEQKEEENGRTAMRTTPLVSSSTIIETSLLGPAASTTGAVNCTSSTTPSERKERTSRMEQGGEGEAESHRLAENARNERDNTIGSVGVHGVDGCHLSPRLEMRLALSHDVMGREEDLISCEPGLSLTTILG